MLIGSPGCFPRGREKGKQDLKGGWNFSVLYQNFKIAKLYVRTNKKIKSSLNFFSPQISKGYALITVFRL